MPKLSHYRNSRPRWRTGDPPGRGMYAVKINDGIGKPPIISADGWLPDTGWVRSFNVVAWQPLPE